ncbi:MAG: beta-glucosidase [Phycisphaerae bacterium]|nr:MAG: beta-glucosidase [Phycisphaerae bacterium]
MTAKDGFIFPEGFVWGAATSAFQIEGAVDAGDRKPSIWDAFGPAPSDGRIACDHHQRYESDVALMGQLGLQAYRFSIAWPRVIPDGAGKPSETGLQFYDRLVDACLEHDVEPYVTLYHWDLPLALHKRGGWFSRDSVGWFADYTELVVKRLSDRVTNWITINEPQVFLSHGFLTGDHAPGEKRPIGEVLQAGHHVLLAHGEAVRKIREFSKKPARIGYAPAGCINLPRTMNRANMEIARKHTMGVSSEHLFNNVWWMDPVLRGSYPEEGLRKYGKNAPLHLESDFEIISESIDFLGLNIYYGHEITIPSEQTPEIRDLPNGHPRTAFGWPVTPEVLYWGPSWLYDRYNTPTYITENGMSNTDWPNLEGRVEDPQRIDFLKRYLAELQKVITDGADVRGYFHWSFLDNFEWDKGCRQRFGLVHVDFETQERIPKSSAYWYRDCIESNGYSILPEVLR